MRRLLVVVPTTGGPAILRRLAPRAGLPVSAAFADGDYRPLPWSADYARLSAPGGPIARALGEAPAPHELRLDRSFDAGRSWETPVEAAHLLIARGFELTDDPGSAEVVLWATGAVDLDLAIISGDYAVAEKLDLSEALFEAAKGAEVIVALPPATAEDFGALGAWPNAKVLRPTSAREIVEAFGKDATSPSPSPLAGEGKGEGALQDEAGNVELVETPPHPTSAFGSGHLLPRGEKGRADTPQLQPSAVANGRNVLRILFALTCLAVLGGGAAIWRFGAPEPAPPPDPVEANQAAKGDETPPPPSPPKPAPAVAIDELRAPSGKTCAQALFGSSAPERRPVAVVDGQLEPSRLDASLCGVAIRAADPAAASVRVTGALSGASSAPQPDAGGQNYWFKEGLRQKLVYEVQALSKDGGAIGDPVRHEVSP